MARCPRRFCKWRWPALKPARRRQSRHVDAESGAAFLARRAHGMSRLKVGIIGAGYIGSLHAAVLARDERVHIVAIHDAVGERAESLAGSIGATAAASAEQLIETSDAVYIATPNTQHTELALASLRAGKHVFCEKPLATSLDDARRILEAASQQPGVFQVGFNRRFAPVYQRLKERLAETPPHSAHVKMNRGELLNPAWVGDPRLTGGFLYETTIHLLDLLRFLFGEIVALDVAASSHEYAEMDDFSCLLRFNSGMHATLASSADAGWMFPYERLEVFCHHTTIVTREVESLTASSAVDDRQQTETMGRLSKEEKWGYSQEDRAFVDAIINNRPAAVTVGDGFKAVELVDACYRAARGGGRVIFNA
ncbi:MAG TPA: Gfo/Idh/MocA family oxidoreductase [Blastocatellia bacterium]|nr:Gfo/Idh/MocA family oxidoreductase [Blastocatellia bacterium]